MADAIAVQLRRGTLDENEIFYGLEGELTAVINGSKTTCRIHDGIKQGGYELALANMVNVDLNAVNIAQKDLGNVDLAVFDERGLLFKDLTNITKDEQQITDAGLATKDLSNVYNVSGDTLTRNNIADTDLSNVSDGAIDTPPEGGLRKKGIAYKDLSNVDLSEAGVMNSDASNITKDGLDNIIAMLLTTGGLLKNDLSNISTPALVQNSGRNKVPNNQGLVNPKGVKTYTGAGEAAQVIGMQLAPGQEAFDHWYMLNGSAAQINSTIISMIEFPKGTIGLCGGCYIKLTDFLHEMPGAVWYLSVEDATFKGSIEDEAGKPLDTNNGLLFCLATVDSTGTIKTQFTDWTKLTAPESEKLNNWYLTWDATTQDFSDKLEAYFASIDSEVAEFLEARAPTPNPWDDIALCIKTDGITSGSFGIYTFKGIQLERERQTLIENMPTFTQTPDQNMMCGTF